MHEDLKPFVRESLARGVPRPEISQALSAAGWRPDEITAALALYAEAEFPVPVPRRKPYLSARETFIYLVLFVCLYISAWAFGALLFEFVNRGLPDPLRLYENWDDTQLRMSVAMLIVAFPIYLWLSSLMTKAIRLDPDKRGSKIRKWLTYLTLFVAAATIIGDLITLFFNLLGGELTLRFFLKVVVVLVIAGAIFGWYLWSLKSEEKTS